MKNKLTYIKKFNRNIIFSFTGVFLLTIGFSSWSVCTGGEGTTTQGNINVSDTITYKDSFKLKINKEYDREEFLNGANVSDPNNYYKLESELTWKNKNSNSNYNGDLTDYFSIYDSKDPTGENSPFLYNYETSKNINFENYKIAFNDEGGSLTSTIHYAYNYDYVDTNNSSFDQNEINRQMEIVSNLINPQNGNEVEWGECQTSGFPSGIKVYYTKVLLSNNYEYRFHVFYHCVGSNTICRADSSYNSSVTESSTQNVTPSLTFVSLTDQSSVQKNGAASLVVRATNLSNSTKTISLSQNRFNNVAGQDGEFDVVDLNKTLSDFEPYYNLCDSYALTHSEEIKPIKNGQTVEVEAISQIDESSNISNSNNPWFYVVGTRNKITNSSNITYYNGYRYYFFYFRMQDDKLCVASVNNTTGVSSPTGVSNSASNNYNSSNSITNSEWPLVIVRTNNGESYNFEGQSANSNANSSSLTPYSRYSRSYVRYFVTFKKNESSNYSNISDNYVYFNGDYYNNIDKTKKREDFDKDSLINYLKVNNSYYNNLPSGDETIFEEYYNEDLPYLYFIISKRKKSNNKYYYFAINMFCYFTGDNSTNNNQIKLTQVNYSGNSTSNETDSDLFTINVHSESDTSYPSYISESYHDEASYIYYDVSYTNNNGSVVNAKNARLNFASNAGSSLGYKHSDFNCTALEQNNEKFNSIYSFNNYYSLYNEIDKDKDYSFNAYLKTHSSGRNVWNFSGYYNRVGYATFVDFSNIYTFSSSLYQTNYSAQGTTENNTNKFITEDEMDSNYYVESAEPYYVSRKDPSMVEYTFKNSMTNDIKKYFLYVPSIGNTTKDRVHLILDKIKTKNINFDYNMTLIPKNDEIKNNMQKIVNCFDFDLNISIKNYEVFR